MGTVEESVIYSGSNLAVTHTSIHKTAMKTSAMPYDIFVIIQKYV